jgi:hypothetical protein
VHQYPKVGFKFIHWFGQAHKVFFIIPQVLEAFSQGAPLFRHLPTHRHSSFAKSCLTGHRNL